MNTPQNTYAFVDSQNLYLSIKSLGWELDMKRLRLYLRDKFRAEKVFLFIGYLSGNERLYTRLQQAGYIIVFKPTLEMSGITKGNCDAELVLHSMIEKEHYEKAIIISGDGGFHCLIEYLAEHSKLLKVGIPNKNKYSSLLRKFRSPYFFYISDLRNLLEYKKR